MLLRPRPSWPCCPTLIAGKDVAEGTGYEFKQRYLRLPYIGVDKDNLGEFLK